jgi:hypothetical protein
MWGVFSTRPTWGIGDYLLDMRKLLEIMGYS